MNHSTIRSSTLYTTSQANQFGLCMALALANRFCRGTNINNNCYNQISKSIVTREWALGGWCLPGEPLPPGKRKSVVIELSYVVLALMTDANILTYVYP